MAHGSWLMADRKTRRFRPLTISHAMQDAFFSILLAISHTGYVFQHPASGRYNGHVSVPARRTRPFAWIVVSTVAIATATWCAVSSRRSARPNVLLITIDTLRADRVGSYGYAAAQTPAIDALAARGLRFMHATTVAPLTLPAHSSLMTGTFPGFHGVRDN